MIELNSYRDMRFVRTSAALIVIQTLVRLRPHLVRTVDTATRYEIQQKRNYVNKAKHCSSYGDDRCGHANKTLYFAANYYVCSVTVRSGKNLGVVFIAPAASGLARGSGQRHLELRLSKQQVSILFILFSDGEGGGIVHRSALLYTIDVDILQ
jgi:hypothetical protein